MEREFVYAVVDCRTENIYGIFKRFEDAELEVNEKMSFIMDNEMEGNPNNLSVERKGDVLMFNGMRMVAIHSYVLR